MLLNAVLRCLKRMPCLSVEEELPTGTPVVLVQVRHDKQLLGDRQSSQAGRFPVSRVRESGVFELPPTQHPSTYSIPDKQHHCMCCNPSTP